MGNFGIERAINAFLAGTIVGKAFTYAILTPNVHTLAILMLLCTGEYFCVSMECLMRRESVAIFIENMLRVRNLAKCGMLKGSQHAMNFASN